MKLTELKSMHIKFRKNRNPLSSFLGFVISECELIGKNDGNRETIESEVVSKLKNLLKRTNESISINETEMLLSEKDLIESLLPEMVDENDVELFIKSNSFSNIGEGMKAIKEKFGQNVDMKKASTVLKEILS